MPISFRQFWNSGRWLAVGMCLGLLTPLTYGAVETSAVFISPSEASYGETLQIPGFDSTLGTLQSVTIKAQGTGNFTQLVENTSPLAESAVAAQSLDLVITMPGLSDPILSLHQSEAHEYRLGGFDGMLDFSSNSGGTYSYPVTTSGQVILNSPNDLVRFLSSSLVELDFSATGSLDRFVGGDKGILEARLAAGLDLTVQFQYVPVPEPMSWGFAGMAMLAIVWVIETAALAKVAAASRRCFALGSGPK